MTASAAEAAFQNDILREMVSGGWVRGDAKDYHRESALYPEDCLAFVKASQPCAGRGAGRVTPGVPLPFRALPVDPWEFA